MSKKAPNKKRFTLRAIYLLILIILFGSVAFAAIRNKFYKEAYTPAYTQNITSDAIKNGPSPVPYTTYTSQNLGISFSYITDSGVQKFFVKEIGDKIYLYASFGNRIQNPEEGKFVEVFSKNPQQSLEQAIKQQFLAGVSGNSCIVKNYSNGQARIDKSYQTVIISAVIPHNPNLSYSDVHSLIANCSQYAYQYDGVSYFMMDPKHPDKLLFLRIGQDDIPSGVGPMWDGTITIQ